MSKKNPDTKGQGKGHDSKGAGNGPGKSDIIKSADEQNAIRRATKRRKDAHVTGLASLANNPHVGATRAARTAAAIQRKQQQTTSETRQVLALVATDHPQISSLTGTARSAALKFLEHYARSPVGDQQHWDPRKWASDRVYCVLSQNDLSQPNAVHLGIMRAKKALDETLNLFCEGFNATPQMADAG